ncbi:MAG: hypothetical protein CL677_06975 [Bdellovibrionaceae bacterium]|nr:hypothetical protein [Pseudobdellovibrionaceae bacterium]
MFNFKKITMAILLTASPLAMATGGDAGNETDEPNGRSTSLTIQLCSERKTFVEFHQEMKIESPDYAEAFEKVKAGYLPLYNEIITRGKKALVCITEQPINTLHPWLPSDKPRVALWIERAEGNMDSLQIDPSRFFAAEKDDFERAGIVMRELLHFRSIQKFEEPNRRSWIMYNLINGLHDYIRNPLTEATKAKLREQLIVAGFTSPADDTRAYCEMGVSICEQFIEMITDEEVYKAYGLEAPKKSFLAFSFLSELKTPISKASWQSASYLAPFSEFPLELILILVDSPQSVGLAVVVTDALVQSKGIELLMESVTYPDYYLGSIADEIRINIRLKRYDAALSAIQVYTLLTTKSKTGIKNSVVVDLDTLDLAYKTLKIRKNLGLSTIEEDQADTIRESFGDWILDPQADEGKLKQIATEFPEVVDRGLIKYVMEASSVEDTHVKRRFQFLYDSGIFTGNPRKSGKRFKDYLNE